MSGRMLFMAELKERLRTDLTAAMRARDQVRTRTRRSALTAITNEEVAGHSARELSDDEVIKVLTREAKKRREAAEAFGSAGPGGPGGGGAGGGPGAARLPARAAQRRRTGGSGRRGDRRGGGVRHVCDGSGDEGGHPAGRGPGRRVTGRG